jgi:hypothetical protein
VRKPHHQEIIEPKALSLMERTALVTQLQNSERAEGFLPESDYINTTHIAGGRAEGFLIRRMNTPCGLTTFVDIPAAPATPVHRMIPDWLKPLTTILTSRSAEDELKLLSYGLRVSVGVFEGRPEERRISLSFFVPIGAEPHVLALLAKAGISASSTGGISRKMAESTFNTLGVDESIHDLSLVNIGTYGMGHCPLENIPCDLDKLQQAGLIKDSSALARTIMLADQVIAKPQIIETPQLYTDQVGVRRLLGNTKQL